MVAVIVIVVVIVVSCTVVVNHKQHATKKTTQVNGRRHRAHERTSSSSYMDGSPTTTHTLVGSPLPHRCVPCHGETVPCRAVPSLRGRFTNQQARPTCAFPRQSCRQDGATRRLLPTLHHIVSRGGWGVVWQESPVDLLLNDRKVLCGVDRWLKQRSEQETSNTSGNHHHHHHNDHHNDHR